MLIVCVSPGYTYVPAARRWCGGMLAPTLLLLLLQARARALDLSACIAPLGMESGQIPDAAISASSSYNDGSVAAPYGRLNTERGGGAWCPREQIAPDAREWLEVDLRAVHVLTAVGTQGRFGNGQGAEFAEAFALEYWRPRLGRWVRYRSAAGAELLPANSNTYLEARTQLSPPVWAQRVRFLPRSTHRRTVCMRVELYGCLWSEGVVAYSMPMGDTRASGLELGDAAYDGAWGSGELRGGLGLLVDGVRGGDELREAARMSRWVGWRNETRAGAPRTPLTLTFEFDRVREFTLVSLHVSNRFMRDVRAPAAAVVRFSVGGRHYQQEAVRADLPPDDIFESARNVTLQLHRRIARFVRLELQFAARWLLVSEVTFRSEPAQGNHSAERGSAERAAPPRAPVPTARRQDPLYVAVLVGVLAALAILLAVAAFLLVQRHRHRKCFASPPPKGALASPARRALDEYAACPAPEDYQEPYGALRRSYSTVLLEMEHLHSDATLPLEDSSVYEYAVPEAGAPLLSEAAAPGVPEVALHRLRMISKLAEGAFGAVFVAEGEGVPEYGGGAAPGARLVAVKFLHAAASADERAAFERDVRVLAALAHPCLARVLGAARAPAALVLEYLELGDLHAALRALPALPPAAALRRVAEQLAAGMAYLEALDFVHRDLAARNCVLGADYRVKIADFGTDNEAYVADYVRVGERVVPLRWAAPEAVLEGRHSTRADVWAWAVTVWEVYGACRRRPHFALSDERVLAGLRRAAAGGRAEVLTRAPRCPRRLHRLLQACWRPEPRARPSFRDLHAALDAPEPDPPD